MITFTVKFSWRDWYGVQRPVTTFVEAESAKQAVAEARVRVADLYGLERVQLVAAEASEAAA